MEKIYKGILLINSMFDWLFGKKRDMERVKTDTKKAFEGVKEDMKGISKWLEHL